MRKRVYLLLVVVLALATTAPAASFWAGLLTNGSWRWGGLGSGPQSNSGANANSGGIQYADTQGTTGGGLVLQAQGAAGFQDSDEDSQEQGMAAGMGQFVGAATWGLGSRAPGRRRRSNPDQRCRNPKLHRGWSAICLRQHRSRRIGHRHPDGGRPGLSEPGANGRPRVIVIARPAAACSAADAARSRAGRLTPPVAGLGDFCTCGPLLFAPRPEPFHSRLVIMDGRDQKDQSPLPASAPPHFSLMSLQPLRR